MMMTNTEQATWSKLNTNVWMYPQVYWDARVRSISVNLAGILGDAEEDPEGLVARSGIHLMVGEGGLVPPRKNEIFA